MQALVLQLALLLALKIVAFEAFIAAPRSADIATVENCFAVTDLCTGGTRIGELCRAGSSQGFAIRLNGGCSYALNTDVMVIPCEPWAPCS